MVPMPPMVDGRAIVATVRRSGDRLRDLRNHSRGPGVLIGWR